jgi:hypothetical protein
LIPPIFVWFKAIQAIPSMHEMLTNKYQLFTLKEINAIAYSISPYSFHELPP